jgi:hypothetical protein
VLANAEEVIRERLEADEQLFWTGKPRQGLRLKSQDGFLIPFSLMWGGFAIFWEATAILGGAPFFFAIWGVPFVLIGLYMMVGRFWVDSRLRAGTFYGLTDRRVVIVSGLLNRTVSSRPLRTLTDVTMTEHSDGCGTISFGPTVPQRPRGAMPLAGTTNASTCLELVENVRDVYEKIMKLQAAAT